MWRFVPRFATIRDDDSSTIDRELEVTTPNKPSHFENTMLDQETDESGRKCIALADACVKVDGVCVDFAAIAKGAAAAPVTLGRQVFAEFLGTLLLVATIIGSGMMGDNLSDDDGVALLGNTLATWAFSTCSSRLLAR